MAAQVASDGRLDVFSGAIIAPADPCYERLFAGRKTTSAKKMKYTGLTCRKAAAVRSSA
jgi:hypothetical protein